MKLRVVVDVLKPARKHYDLGPCDGVEAMMNWAYHSLAQESTTLKLKVEGTISMYCMQLVPSVARQYKDPDGLFTVFVTRAD